MQIELMNELRAKVSEIIKKGIVKKVGMRNQIDNRVGGVYTTKHFVYGSFIKEVFVEAMRNPELLEPRRNPTMEPPSPSISLRHINIDGGLG